MSQPSFLNHSTLVFIFLSFSEHYITSIFVSVVNVDALQRAEEEREAEVRVSTNLDLTCFVLFGTSGCRFGSL